MKQLIVLGFLLLSFSLRAGVVQTLDSLRETVSSAPMTVDECATLGTNYYDYFYNIRSEDILEEGLDSTDLDKIIETSFKTRLAIRERMDELRNVDEVNNPCVEAIRNNLRALRYVEDYAIEMKLARQPEKAQDEYVTLEGESPILLVAPKYQGVFHGWEDVQSGDVILSRGNAFTSAAIARIGSNDAQFSHLTLAYKDPKGKLHTVEAHIEIGNVVAPFQKHLDQKNSRTLVFRHKDRELSAKVAKYMYDKVKKRQMAGDNIQYDFAMNYKDGEKLFCSEVVSHGFSEVSGGEVEIPYYKTGFNKGLIPFLQDFGMQINAQNYMDFDTFAPGDIDYDTDFDLVAEWRNPEKLRDSRMKDAVLTAMFRWMEKKGYELDHSTGTSMTAAFSWLIRHTPILGIALANKFPSNMNTGQLKLFMTLEGVAEKIYDKLKKREESLDHPMTPVEMQEFLEALRVEDRAKLAKYNLLQRKLKKIRHKKGIHASRERRKLRKQIKSLELLFHDRFK